MFCNSCNENRASILRSKTKEQLCKLCFFAKFEDEVHATIEKVGMFKRGMKVILGMSGGKDSTALAYILNLLNVRHNYGIEILLVCIDEGIKGYRDHALRVAKEFSKGIDLPLFIFSFETLFNTTMDNVVIKNHGSKGACTHCGKMRREGLNEAAKKLNGDLIVTGHNADDVAETVLLNLFRGDKNKLVRSTLPVTGNRAKPFFYSFQKEIVLYAHFKQLKYFSTECTYSSGAFRGEMRTYLKELERINPNYILNIIKSGEEYIE